MVEHPELWRLALRHEPEASLLHVMLTAAMLHSQPGVADSLIYKALPLDAAAPSGLAALEDAVYANELLLSDFERVDWVYSSPFTLAVPADATEAQCEAFFGEAFGSMPTGGLNPPELFRTTTANAALLTATETATTAFLRRTFHNVHMLPALGVLVNYFTTSPSRGNGRRMNVNFRSASIDVVVTDRNRLLHASTMVCRTGADAAYVVMACHRQLGMDPVADPVVLSGESPLRDAAAPILGRFVAQVLPAIFPSDMLRAGRDAMHAPFELTAAMLVEG